MKTLPEPTAKLPVDIEDVRLKLEQLAAEGRVADLIELVVQLLVGLRDTNTALSVRLANALRELYGRKSQKVSSEQLSLMLAALSEAEQKGAEPAPAASDEAAAQPAGDGSVPQPPDPPKPPRGRGGRAPLPSVDVHQKPRKFERGILSITRGSEPPPEARLPIARGSAPGGRSAGQGRRSRLA
ncbi:uncharacterized protein SOCE26_074080 [Sorangium cellulosum]|uniref:Transposase TnpC homeodomain domain-containing protein n=1 Tax=Sorangium cellulosum TaxID=56 RepID=A0A2L0F2Z9_SORCE|nr:hypothetical protein [Sorangium cellulosum]AUX45907.1 uncharacterized protein SOCE26_074080 [Sorangium cellulosum]